MADVAMATFGALFGLPLVYAGGAMIRKGRSIRADLRRMAATERSEAGSLAPGPVEIRGKATPSGDREVLSDPVDSEEALLVRVTVERRTRDRDPDRTGKGAWTIEHETVASVPFVVEDGTGRVPVEVGGDATVAVHGEGRSRVRRGPGDEDPRGVRDFLQREANAGASDPVSEVAGRPMDGEHRRFTVDVVRPGTEVYVLGTARHAAGWDEEFVVSGTGEDELILSDRSEPELRQGNAVGEWVLYGIGGVLSLFGVLFAVVPWLL